MHEPTTLTMFKPKSDDYFPKEFYEWKASLKREARAKLKKLPIAERNEPIFIYEWYDDGIDTIFGYGCSRDGKTKILLPNLKPRLFLVSPNFAILEQVMMLRGSKVRGYDIWYTANDFKLADFLQNPSIGERRSQLCSIEFDNMAALQETYRQLLRNDTAYHYAIVSQYYDATKQIMFEILLRNVHAQVKQGKKMNEVELCVPEPTQHWFISNLTSTNAIPAPVLPVITYDIETVSDDAHRVPTGSDVWDILYTVSIHHCHTNRLYTLLYLPLNAVTPAQMHDAVYKDGYKIVPDESVDETKCENIVECFTSERDLLHRTMELLTLRPYLHVLLGYNSMGYDIKYLLTRCVYYNMHEHVNQFMWREGYCYTAEQIHIDLFRVVLMRYRLKQYTLNYVSGHIMKDSKTGVDAVALRFSFYYMRMRQMFLTQEKSSARLPSVRDTLHYNNADTLLVSKLESRTQSIQFAFDLAQRCRVPLSMLMSSYSKMQYKLWNECMVVGLQLGLFMGAFKNGGDVEFHLPYTGKHQDDAILARYNLTSDLNGSEMIMVQSVAPEDVRNSFATASTAALAGTQFSHLPRTAQNDSRINVNPRLPPPKFLVRKKNALFPGGANYCLGEYDAMQVQMYDYVTAYPLLMDRKNISDETTIILPANVLLRYVPNLWSIRDQFTCFDYLTHHGKTHAETAVLYYQYINEDLYCGGEFPLSVDELMKRNKSLVICIWLGADYTHNTQRPENERHRYCTRRRGVLSEIIAHFNAVRAHTKSLRKMLSSAETLITEKINALRNEQITMRLMMEEFAATQNQSTNKSFETENDKVEDLGPTFDDDDDDDNNSTGDENESNDIGPTFDDNGDTDNDDDNDEPNKAVKPDDDDIGPTFDDDEDDDIGPTFDDDEDDKESTNDDDIGPTFDDDDDSNDDGDDNSNQSNPETSNTINEKSNNNPTTDNNEFQNNNNKHEKSNYNFYKFRFANKYCTIFENQMCFINDDELKKLPDYDAQIDCLKQILNNINIELATISNSYDLQKALVSSIYGCCGKMIPMIAAAITCITRSTLLNSAKYCRSHGNDILYIDTDSIMMSSDQPDLSPALNQLYPFMEMEMKVADRCMFVKRKTYYKIENDKLKYGQHVNGPVAWRDCVMFFFQRADVFTNEDVQKLFREFFNKAYEQLFNGTNGELTSEVSEYAKERVSLSLKMKNEYKTETPTAKLQQYLAMHYPELAGANKHTVFCYMNCNSVTELQYRPALELRTLGDLAKVNLFKYYQSMFATIFNLIKFNVRSNNEPFHITLAATEVLLWMLEAYMTVYEERFPNACIASNNALEDIKRIDVMALLDDSTTTPYKNNSSTTNTDDTTLAIETLSALEDVDSTSIAPSPIKPTTIDTEALNLDDGVVALKPTIKRKRSRILVAEERLDILNHCDDDSEFDIDIATDNVDRTVYGQGNSESTIGTVTTTKKPKAAQVKLVL